MTTLVIVYDHIGNTYHLSELTELLEGRIPYPEQFANMLDYEQKPMLQDLLMKDLLRTNWIKQGEEFLQQVSIFQEASLQQIVSSIYYPNEILKNLSEQDICFDSKDMIDRERNSVDLNDQRDSKGQKILFTSFKIWNILDKIFVLIHVQLHALSAIQQLQRYAIVFRNVLASNRISAVEEATYNSLIGHEDFL